MMSQRQLNYARVSSEQLLFCLRQATLEAGRLSNPEVREIEEVVLARMKPPPEVSDSARLCPKCSLPITGDERHVSGGKMVCDDCYYEEFGEEVENHPICHPRVHRG